MVRTRGRDGRIVRRGQPRRGVSTSMHGELAIDLGNLPYSGILPSSDPGSPYISSHSSTPSSSPSSSIPSSSGQENFGMLIHTPLYHLVLLVFQYHQDHHPLLRLTIRVSLNHSTRLRVFHSTLPLVHLCSPPLVHWCRLLLIPLSTPHLLHLSRLLLALCKASLTMLTMVPLLLQSITSPLRRSSVTLMVGSSSDFLEEGKSS